MLKRILCALCAAILLASCFGCTPTETKKITVNEVTHSIFYAPFYAALNLGYFEEEKIQIELTNGGGSDKSMTALLAGQADIALLGPETAIYVINEGKEDYPVIIAQLTKKDGSFLLGKQPDSDFSWDKLRGKSIIGGRTGGMPNTMLKYVMKKNGVEPNVDATVRSDVSFDLMGGAFIGGDDDYVALFEPVASTMELANQGFIVASIGEDGGDVPYTCFMMLKSRISRDKTLADAFLKVIIRAQKWIQTASISEIADAIAPSFPDSDMELLTTVVKRYKDIDVWKAEPELDKEGYGRLVEVMKEEGLIDKAPDYEKIIGN